MSNNLSSVRRITIAILAASLVACGTVQGATPGGAGTQLDEPRSDVHLTEYDTSDTRAAPSQLGGSGSSEVNSSPALVP